MTFRPLTFRHYCSTCGRAFWTSGGYRLHVATDHLMAIVEATQGPSDFELWDAEHERWKSMQNHPSNGGRL